MRGVMIHAPGDIRVEDRPDPVIEEPTDAIIRMAATCICGSDLWPYRGYGDISNPHPWGMSTWAWSSTSVPTSRT